MRTDVRICQICKKPYSEPPTLSRKGNKTLICPECEMKEVVEVWNEAEK